MQVGSFCFYGRLIKRPMVTIARAEVSIVNLCRESQPCHFPLYFPKFYSRKKKRKEDRVANCRESSPHHANCNASSVHVSRTIPFHIVQVINKSPPKALTKLVSIIQPVTDQCEKINPEEVKSMTAYPRRIAPRASRPSVMPGTMM